MRWMLLYDHIHRNAALVCVCGQRNASRCLGRLRCGRRDAVLRPFFSLVLLTLLSRTLGKGAVALPFLNHAQQFQSFCAAFRCVAFKFG